MAFNQGQLKSSQITAVAKDAGIGQRPDVRRLYDFSDRVAELMPEESPFFVYLSKVAKVPTDDNIFRFLENRTVTNWTSRTFDTAAAVNGGSAVAANETHSFTVDIDSGTAIGFLVKGMVFAVRTNDADNDGYSQVLVRVESAPTVGSVSTSFTGRVIDLSASGVDGYATIPDGSKCQIVGTSYGEGTGSPDTFSDTLDDNFGYTQIFKTACEMTNTAIATRYRGYSNEFDRIWAQKLREHKVDIERAMLFGQKARTSDGIQYSEGLVGNIVKNVNPNDGNTALSFSSGKAYNRTLDEGELTYDRLLSDLEVIFDPARGGANERLCLASLPVISYFNKMGDGAFLDSSMGYSNSPFKLNDDVAGSFGHRLMEINTVHGSLYLVKEPLFRGIASGFMLMADMSKLAYRPLVGNGLNRDTQIMTNVQASDEDLRKDMILTEAGLEITLPESHALYNVEGI